MSQHFQDLLIDALLDYGFTLDEAKRLLELHERVQGHQRERRDEEERRRVRMWLGEWDPRNLLN